jgi:hypothetical protein
MIRLTAAGTDAPTSEHQLLALVLEWLAQHPELPFPLAFSRTSRWMVQARAPLPFAALYRGDTLAGTATILDGAVGELAVAGEPHTPQLRLLPGATQLSVVCLAEATAPLRGGYLAQPAASAAAIAELLRRANQPPREMALLSLSWFVPLAAVSPSHDALARTRSLIDAQVARRVREHEGRLNSWYGEWFQPALERLTLQSISWEAALDLVAQYDPAAMQAFAARYHQLAPPLQARARG